MMKSFSLAVTALLPLASTAFVPMTCSSTKPTALFSTPGGRPTGSSSSSSSSSSNGAGRSGPRSSGGPAGSPPRAGGGAPRVGRSPRGGARPGGGPRAPPAPPREGGFAPGNMPGGHSEGPDSMNGRSMNAQRSGRSSASSSRRGGGGGSMNYGAGAEYDYSGGNLRYGTGKYQQRANDGYSGGVNLSTNGHSMQHNVYTGGRDYGASYDRAYGRTMMEDMMYDDMMMEEEMMMMYDEFGDDMMSYEDTMMMGGGRMGPRGGGGVFRDEYYERSGRGGPRAYSNARNGGYTTNGRSHQFNSRMDERRRYSDDFYYGDDAYFAERGGYGDYPPERTMRSGMGGGPAGLLRDELF